jgi:hypothetical protein
VVLSNKGTQLPFATNGVHYRTYNSEFWGCHSCITGYFDLLGFLLYSESMEMKATHSFLRSGTIYPATQSHISEGRYPKLQLFLHITQGLFIKAMNVDVQWRTLILCNRDNMCSNLGRGITLNDIFLGAEFESR